MSQCSRSQKALEILEEIGRGIESLKGLVQEGPGEDEKKPEKEESIREKALDCAGAMYVGTTVGILGLDTLKYEGLGARADLIEALVQEEVEACLEIAEKELDFGSGQRIHMRIKKRLSR